MILINQIIITNYFWVNMTTKKIKYWENLYSIIDIEIYIINK